MAKSSKRSKARSGQPAGEQTTGKKEATQPAAGAAQPATKAAPGSNKSGVPAPAKPPDAAVVSKASQPATRVPASFLQAGKRDQKREAVSQQIEARRKQREAEERKRQLKRWGIYGSIGLALAALVLVGYFLFFGPGVPPYRKGDTIDGISCDQGEHSQTHYHVQLQMYVNGQAVPFPDNAGRQSITACLYWLHTHASNGIIHIEAPADGTYTLGQFFDIWGQPLSKTQFMNNPVDAQHQLTIYVFNPTQQQLDQKNQAILQAEQAGKDPPPFTVTPPADLQPTTGDPRQIQLTPNAVIYLSYGTPVVTPKPYTFTYINGE